MKFPPAAAYRSKIANDVASSVVVPNRIAPRLSTLTVRADNAPLPMVVYRMPPTLAVRVHSKSSIHRLPLRGHEGPLLALVAFGSRRPRRQMGMGDVSDCDVGG